MRVNSPLTCKSGGSPSCNDSRNDWQSNCSPSTRRAKLGRRQVLDNKGFSLELKLLPQHVGCQKADPRQGGRGQVAPRPFAVPNEFAWQLSTFGQHVTVTQLGSPSRVPSLVCHTNKALDSVPHLW